MPQTAHGGQKHFYLSGNTLRQTTFATHHCACSHILLENSHDLSQISHALTNCGIHNTPSLCSTDQITQNNQFYLGTEHVCPPLLNLVQWFPTTGG